MTAGSALSAAVCRRLCVGRAVVRCAALRAAVAALGGDGSAGEGLAEALAAPTAGGGWEHEGEGGRGRATPCGLRAVRGRLSLGRTRPLGVSACIEMVQQAAPLPPCHTTDHTKK